MFLEDQGTQTQLLAEAAPAIWIHFSFTPDEFGKFRVFMAQAVGFRVRALK